MMNLDNSVIAITGGARGLGLAMAELLGSGGARLALIDTGGATLDTAVSALHQAGIEARGFVANVADEASVQQAFGDIAGSLGPVSGVCNNAGTRRDALAVKAEE